MERRMTLRLDVYLLAGSPPGCATKTKWVIHHVDWQGERERKEGHDYKLDEPYGDNGRRHCWLKGPQINFERRDTGVRCSRRVRHGHPGIRAIRYESLDHWEPSAA